MSINDKSRKNNSSSVAGEPQKRPDIDALVADLKPTSVLNNAQLWLAVALSLPLITIILLIPRGLRPDFAVALDAGTVFWKAGLFILLAGAMILWVKSLSRPAAVASKVAWPLLMALMVLFSAVYIGQVHAVDTANTTPILITTTDMAARALGQASGAWSCFASVIVGGVVSFAVLWAFWLRKTACVFPRKLGLVSGLFCGALAAMIYSLQCTQDNVFYILFYYGGSILSMGVMGRYMGAKYMKW